MVLVEKGEVAVSFSLQLRSNIVVVIDGTLSTDGNPHSSWHGHKALLLGDNLANTTITGSGTIDGNGSAWWPIRKHTYSFFAPTMLYCTGCSRMTLSQLRIRNTPAWGVEFPGGKAILVDGIDSESPHYSANTDGVGLDCAGGPHEPCILRNSRIYNGDDEVAVGGSNVLVEDCEFGTGHGASIGSLGYNGSTAYVSNITFRRLRFNRTTTTMRIKAWQGGHGLVTNVSYSDIRLLAVHEPLLITQYYCPLGQNGGPCKNQSSAVKVDGVSFERVTGSWQGIPSQHNTPGQILCSDTVANACTNITMRDIDLVWVASNNMTHPNQSGVAFDCYSVTGGHQHNVTPPGCFG